MTGRFQILSLDGGGIKGIFSAAVLAHLEDDLQIRIAEHFDLITGAASKLSQRIALQLSGQSCMGVSCSGFADCY